MSKCFLVSGATGFLGSHIVKKLIDEGQKVIILKRSFSNCWRINGILTQVKSYNIDQMDEFSPMFKEQHIDGVIHTATCYGRQGESVEQIYDVNLTLPLKLLNMAIRFNSDSFFNSDTILYKYLNWYSLSKKQFSEIGKQFSECKKIKFINAKLQHMYGEDDSNTKFVPFLLEALTSNEVLKLTEGVQKRDFVYIDDVVEAYWKILNYQELVKGYQQFEIGTGKAVSIRKFAELAKELTNSQTELAFGALPYRKNEIMYSEADISKLVDIGWCPNMTLREGLKKVVNYMRNKKI